MKSVLEIDRVNSYLKHRLRVQCAKSKIDHHLPILHAGNFCRFTALKEDVQTSLAINKHNAKLLEAINLIARTRGVVDSFRTKENFLTPNYSKLPQKKWQLDELDQANMKLGKRILCTKGELNTWLDAKYINDKDKNPITPFQYPNEVLSKYSQLSLPKEPQLLKKFLRPKIWFYMEVKGVRPLGRLIIELYTEAAPQIVFEFVRLCSDKQKERLNFVRLFPSLWLEAEVSLDSKTLIQKNIEYDKRSVDQGRYNGVLSFSLDNMNLNERGILNFTISFKPLRVLNGRRIGFGRVSKDHKVLNCLQDYGTKNGKPTKEIVVSNCGLFI